MRSSASAAFMGAGYALIGCAGATPSLPPPPPVHDVPRAPAAQVATNPLPPPPPPTIAVALVPAREVSVSDQHACALLTNGAIHCWGDNRYGQLGVRALIYTGAGGEAYKPVKIPFEGQIERVFVGRSNTCLLMKGGVLECYGAYGSEGRPIDGHRVRVRDLSDVHVAALGPEHACAARSDGTVWCWGTNRGGSSGGGAMTPLREQAERETPRQVPGLQSVIDLCAGNDMTCALRSDHVILCWGDNASGGLGDGTTQARATPAPVPGIQNAAQVSCGGFSACARLLDGSVSCWGDNRNGQLGDGTKANRPSPRAIEGLSGVVELSIGYDHGCARTQDGRVVCWGGDISKWPFPSVRPAIVEGVSNVVQISSGGLATCARGEDGRVVCWGDNAGGHMGMGCSSPCRPGVVQF